MADFDPNRLTLAEGMDLIKNIQKEIGIDTGEIFTSLDLEEPKRVDGFATSNVPGGFSKWALPTFFEGPTLQYMSYAGPGVHVPDHSHDEGAGLRVIMSGSIIYDGRELREGDWMFIPAGRKYSFKVGERGVGMFYCYSCCCA
jgi:hypothetical protein